MGPYVNACILSFMVLILQVPLGHAKWNELDETFGSPTLCTLFKPNYLVDALMGNSLKVLKGPLKLPAINITQLNLLDGVVYGLDTLTRFGEANTDCVGDYFAVRTILQSTKPIKGIYSCRSGPFGGKINVGIENFKADMILTTSMRGDRPKVQSFNVTNIEGINVRMEGMGFFNNKFSWIGTALANEVKYNAQKLINPLLLNFMNTVVIDKLLGF